MKTLKNKLSSLAFKFKTSLNDLLHTKIAGKDEGMELIQVVIIIVIALIVATFVVAFITGNFLPKFQNKISSFTDDLFTN